MVHISTYFKYSSRVQRYQCQRKAVSASADCCVFPKCALVGVQGNLYLSPKNKEKKQAKGETRLQTNTTSLSNTSTKKPIGGSLHPALSLMAAAFSEVGKTVQTTSYKSKLRNPSFIKRPTSDCPAVFLLSILTTCFRPCKAECEKMDGIHCYATCGVGHINCAVLQHWECCSAAVQTHSHLHQKIRPDQRALQVRDANAHHTCTAPDLPRVASCRSCHHFKFSPCLIPLIISCSPYSRPVCPVIHVQSHRTLAFEAGPGPSI